VSPLIGTTDLHTYRRLKDADGIVKRVEQIIDRIKTAALQPRTTSARCEFQRT
jgi:hypothetical protein